MALAVPLLSAAPRIKLALQTGVFLKQNMLKTKRRGLDERLGWLSPARLAAQLGYVHSKLRRGDAHHGVPRGVLHRWATSGGAALEPGARPAVCRD